MTTSSLNKRVEKARKDVGSFADRLNSIAFHDLEKTLAAVRKQQALLVKSIEQLSELSGELEETIAELQEAFESLIEAEVEDSIEMLQDTEMLLSEVEELDLDS